MTKAVFPIHSTRAIMTTPPQTLPTASTRPRFIRAQFAFVLSIAVILYVPALPLAPWLQTFIHTWRPELAVSLLLIVTSTFAFRSASFGKALANISRQEFVWILAPIICFISWSFISAIWAPSTRSVIHHSLVWTSYLLFYVFCRWQISTGTDLRNAKIALLGVIVLICLPAVIEYYGFLIAGNATSIGLRYSKYAEIVNAILPLLIVAAIGRRSKLTPVFLAAIVAIWLFDIGTQRRSAIGIFPLAAVATMAAVLAFKKYRGYARRMLPAAAAVVVVPIVVLSISSITIGEDPAVSRMSDWTVEMSNNARPLFGRIGLEMFRDAPVTGIGGDNYGQQFNGYAKRYAAVHPTDPGLAAIELGIPERAHNEYIQVLAELGIVGFVLFGWMLAGVIVLGTKALFRPGGPSLNTIAALIGIGTFLASSTVSSYSFRLVQNGLIFFLLLAVAMPGLVEISGNKAVEKASSLRFLRLGVAATGLLAVFFAVFSLSRAASVYYCGTGANERSGPAAEESFQRAIGLDPENATAYSAFGGHFLDAGRPREAAIQLRRSIDLGRSTPSDYSYLATAFILAGDYAEARDALAEAVGVYPRSLFLRTRYSVVLAELGEHDGSVRQFEIAKFQNEPAARSWRNLVEFGADKAGRMAFEEKLPALMELQPTPAVYAMVADRELRFPEERNAFPF